MAAKIDQMPEAPTAANNVDIVSLQISLPQLLDLALGSPEVGAVNFNILHNFLHILLHQLNLQAIKVEYRDQSADRIQRMVTALKQTPPLQLYEYNITDAIGEVPQRIRRDDGVDADVLTEDIQPEKEILKVTEDMKPQIDLEKIETPTVVNGPLPTTIQFKELEQSVKQLQQQYQALEDLSKAPDVVERLKDKVTEATADALVNINKRLEINEQGIDKLTATIQDVIKGDISIADISLINTRLDELESKVSKMEEWLINLQTVTDILTENITAPTTTGIDVAAVEEKVKPKVTEPVVIDDVIVPDREIEEKANEISKVAVDKIQRAKLLELPPPGTFLNGTIAEIRQDITTLKTDVTRIHQDITTLKTDVSRIHQDVTTLKSDVTRIQRELQDLSKRVEQIKKIEIPTEIPTEIPIVDVPSIQERPSRIHQDVTTLKTDVSRIHQDVTTLKSDVTGIQRELQDLSKRVEQIKKIEIPTEIPIVDVPSIQERPVVEEPIKEKIVEVRDVTNLEQCLEAIKNVETTYSKALNDVTQRTIALKMEIEYLLKKVDSMQEADKIGDININKLIAKMQGIETDMERIGQTMDKLLNDKEQQDTHINTLLEQIELLKIVKANKEDLKDALADKADIQTMNRKVSHDQFDAACDDLARGLEVAINKLAKQESIWQQALDEVQNEIATKMDKNELTPLKDFVNNKLKSLQEKLKFMVEARQEIEAAGTKKLLRDVQCISCNKDVVMKTEEVGRFRAEPLPCTISMKPYLTYKLDKIRKLQKRLPYSRNMIHFEAAMQEEMKMKAKEEIPTTPEDHLCNRYCGGSHTITTPQQRVMRTGHYLTQWGPEMIQLTDGLIRGKDGQMYRSRLMSDVCGPDCWEGQINVEITPSECGLTTPRNRLPFRRHSAGKRVNNGI